jgi:peptidoglycan DL-endopeptidase LytE
MGVVKSRLFAIVLALGLSSAWAGSYTVQPKDTLYSIAKKFNSSVGELQKLNQLQSNSVNVGQVLIVPDPQKVHVVAAKETLFSIARRYGVTVKAMLEANKLSSNDVKIGQQLLIPNSSVAQPSAPTTSNSAKPPSVSTKPSSSVTDSNAKPSSNPIQAQPSSTTKPSSSLPPKLSTLSTAPKPQISSTVVKPQTSNNPVSSSSNPVKPAKPEVVPTMVKPIQTAQGLATTSGNPDLGATVAPTVPPSSSLPARPATPATLKPPATGNVKPSTSSANTNAVLPNARGSDAPIAVPVLKNAPLPNLSTPPTAPVIQNTVVDTGSVTPTEQPLPEANSDTPELFYTVVAGETLYRIALRYNATIESIRAANKLTSDAISAGQRIKIPVAATAAIVPPANSSQQGVSEVSQRYLGVTYRYGGTTASGLDCSGFVQIVFAEMGLKLPRTSALQFQAGIEVAREDLTEGDLVFFDTIGGGVSHVGIYLKDNQFIHAASNPGKITISSLTEKYWQPKYLGARRVLTDD